MWWHRAVAHQPSERTGSPRARPQVLSEVWRGGLDPVTVCGMTQSAVVTLRARTGFALLAAAAFLLSGCTGVEGAPSGDATSGGAAGTPTESAPQMSGDYVVGADGKLLKPTDGPVPIAPTPPASITEDTPEAAEEFARYFVAVAEYAWNSGDTTELRAISTEDCDLCQGLIEDIDAESDSGGWTNGLTYLVHETEEPVQHPSREEALAIVLHIETSDHVAYRSSKLTSHNSERELLELHSCWSPRGWLACGGAGAHDPDF